MHIMRLYDSAMHWSYTTSIITPIMDKAGLRTGNQDQGLSFHFSKLKGSLIMEPIANHTSVYTAKAPTSSFLLGKLNLKEVVKQVDGEKKVARRIKINKADKVFAGICLMIEGNPPRQVSSVMVKTLIGDKEKEVLRRKRISQANKGKVPWNKGGKHSAETKKRIQAGVLERMKDPKVREKLRLQAEAVKLSPEIKTKIRMGIIRAWVAKKQLKVKQELCLIEWEESIAESARTGCKEDGEHQWNSYSVLRRKGLQALARNKRVPRGRPDHLSAEHRLRISAAIKAKWNNADYRINVKNGIRKFLSERIVTPRQERAKVDPRQPLPKPSKGPIIPNIPHVREGLDNLAHGDVIAQNKYHKIDTPMQDLSSLNDIQKSADVKAVEKAGIMELDYIKSSSDMASYKDPEAEKKLQKLKSMRAHRMHAEAQKHKDITDRARALIAQAQEAARALEAAAVQDKNALAPLLETRKLLAEAVYSLESLHKKKFISDSIVKGGDAALYAQVMSLANSTPSPLLMVNGCWELESTSVESSRRNT